jgi:hypothetical protein
LGIRQARYFGRTKTLFQVCLAAAVANLTLLAAASSTRSEGDSPAVGWWPAFLAVMLALCGLVLGSTLAILISRTTDHLHQLIQQLLATTRSLTARSRPGF